MGTRGAGVTLSPQPPPHLSHHQLKLHPTPTGITFSTFLAELLNVLGDNLVPVLIFWSQSQPQPRDSLGDLQCFTFWILIFLGVMNLSDFFGLGL